MAKGKGPVFILLLFLIIGILTLISFTHVSELHSDTDKASPIQRSVPVTVDVLPGEFEPIVDPSLIDASENPTLAAAAVCRVLDIVHRQSHPYYGIEYAGSAKTTGSATTDEVLSKVRRWKDPRAKRNEKGVSIFCIAYTEGGDGPKNMRETWLTGCDDYLVVSRFPTPPEGIDKDHYHEVHVVLDTKPDSMFPRITQTLHMLALTRASEFDYFVYITDDSHVVTENLRMALNDPSIDGLHRMGAPLYLGHRMVTGDNIAFLSNAMMIMNTHLMKLFRTILPDHRCFVNHHGGSEDLFISRCLLGFRIYPLTVEDVFGQERLHILQVDGVSAGGGGGWYNDYHRGYTIPKGLPAFSRSSFHFHTVSGGEQKRYQQKIQ